MTLQQPSSRLSPRSHLSTPSTYSNPRVTPGIWRRVSPKKGSAHLDDAGATCADGAAGCTGGASDAEDDGHGAKWLLRWPAAPGPNPRWAHAGPPTPPPPPLSIAAKLSPASPAARNCSQRIRLLQVTIPAGLQPGQQFEMLVPAPAPPPPLPVVQGSLIAKAQPAAPAYPQQGGYPAQPAGNQVVHHHVHSSGGYPQGPPGYPQGPQGYGGGGYYSGGYHQHPQQYHNGRGSGGNMALGIGGGLMGGLMLGSMMDGGLFD